jgi:iron complex outermembrane receptor protein
MTYTQPIIDDVKAVFHIDYDYSSAYVIAQGLLFKAQPETLNASIAVEVRKGLEVSIWGRNLTEPKYNSVIFPGVAQGGTLSAYPSPPRFYGGSIRYKF